MIINATNLDDALCYDVILADPPWQYSDLGHDRRVDRIYPLMFLDQLMQLGRTLIDKIRAEDCVLFLWTTSPMLLREAPAVINSWGFVYKASIIWDKEIM